MVNAQEQRNTDSCKSRTYFSQYSMKERLLKEKQQLCPLPGAEHTTKLISNQVSKLSFTCKEWVLGCARRVVALCLAFIDLLRHPAGAVGVEARESTPFVAGSRMVDCNPFDRPETNVSRVPKRIRFATSRTTKKAPDLLHAQKCRLNAANQSIFFYKLRLQTAYKVALFQNRTSQIDLVSAQGELQTPQKRPRPLIKFTLSSITKPLIFTISSITKPLIFAKVA